jgi:uncharacterized membrane protein
VATADHNKDLLDRVRPHVSDHDHVVLKAALDAHEHPLSKNANEVEQNQLSVGQLMADRITGLVGSWRFIISQSVLLGGWLIVNGIGWALSWDPYPFILLNLVLSFQAAFTAPIIMMSQNRQTTRDRMESELDYDVNRRAEAEVAMIQARLADLTGRQWDALVTLQEEQLNLLRDIAALSTRPDRHITQPGAPTSGQTPG